MGTSANPPLSSVSVELSTSFQSELISSTLAPGKGESKGSVTVMVPVGEKRMFLISTISTPARAHGDASNRQTAIDTLLLHPSLLKPEIMGCESIVSSKMAAGAMIKEVRGETPGEARPPRPIR